MAGKSTTGKLFVGQIPKTATEAELRPHFETCGTLHEVYIMRDREGGSKGCAWITYVSDECAKAAIEHLNGKVLLPGQTSPLQVKHANPQGWAQQYQAASAAGAAQFSEPGQNRGGRKVFVGRIPKTADEDSIRSWFGDCGVIEEVAVIKDRNNGEPKGCCFVTFSTKQEARAACETMHETIKHPGYGEKMQVRLASGEEPQPVKLFVGQLPQTATEEAIQELFSGYGELGEVKLLRTREDPSRHKGCAFVHFADSAEAKGAVAALHKQYQWDGKFLEVRLANPDGKTGPAPPSVLAGPVQLHLQTVQVLQQVASYARQLQAQHFQNQVASHALVGLQQHIWSVIQLHQETGGGPPAKRQRLG